MMSRVSIYSDNVKRACKNEDIHHHLWEDDDDGNPPAVPSWVLTKKECVEADMAMTKVIGKCSFEERPSNVMRAGKAKKCHDTIFWGMTYARWCLRDKGCPVYMENILDILDIMSQLHSGRMHLKNVVEVIKPKLVALLVARAGLLPPSECMLTLHEILHICDQVVEVGVPRMSSLYKFERMNLVLKKLLKNAAQGNSIYFMSIYVDLRFLCILIYVDLR
jgi:hypothetical protein